MKIIEAINRVDDLKHNTYSYATKVKWLSTLDALVKGECIDTHEGGEGIVFNGYNAETDPETVLLAGEPHDEMYIRWLEAQIDYANREYTSYNNAIEMFNATWTAFKSYYRQHHMPITRGNRFVF